MLGPNLKRLVVAMFITCWSPAVVHAQSVNFTETQKYVHETCPIPWENLINFVQLNPGDDIWQGVLGDKVRYINFSSLGFVADDSDAGGYLKIKRYSDAESIPACGLMRSYFFSAARLDSVTATVFDHTVIRDPDLDGVFNPDDVCEGTLAGESVDADGCSAAQLASDEDGDGVHDYIDECPGTAPQDTPNEVGCAPIQLDADLDGIPNSEDAYPLQHNTMCPAN